VAVRVIENKWQCNFMHLLERRRVTIQKPPRPCSRCRQATFRGGLCRPHYLQKEQHRNLRRGSAAQRGYDQDHRELFRAPVLERDLWCVVCDDAPATVADHYPLSRKELVAQGLDPNDPEHGRGLCKPCHDSYSGSTKK
jgi:5-methylcytosine-specific restriction enzyme A